MLHPSPKTSGLRAPEPSPIRVSRRARPDSDDDDDEGDVRFTHSQTPANSAEASHHPSRDPSHEVRDGPSTSSQPKADDSSVPAPAGTTPNVPFSVSLTLRNTGSVARDHLASERTFLAYVRTSLSFASAGVALVQLFRVSVSASVNSSSSTSHDQQPIVASYARPLGATLIAFGMVVLGMGTRRYFLIQRMLPQGVFPAARLSVFLQAVSLATIVAIVFGILVAVH